jgi:hypothetical protein
MSGLGEMVFEMLSGLVNNAQRQIISAVDAIAPTLDALPKQVVTRAFFPLIEQPYMMLPL